MAATRSSTPPGSRKRSPSAELSAAEARRLTLASLGFGARKPAKAGIAHVRAVADRLNAIQIDSVNVLARAHYMPAFSRLGPYPMNALDTLAYDKRELFEYWGHAACFLPMRHYPLYRWRMDVHNNADYWRDATPAMKRYVEAVYDDVAERGPLSGSEVKQAGMSSGNWWGWSDGKSAVETLWRSGRLAIAGRRNFERLYDITERVVPADVRALPVPPVDESKKRLIVLAATSHGIGTAEDIGGYFHVEGWWDRQKVGGKRTKTQLPRLVKELVDEGRLERVAVGGWDKPGYVVPGTKVPRTVDARALVSPFDPLLWQRTPTQRIFGFDYKIEIYVPEPKRIYGYYVLPFVLGDRFVARVDLKADRKSRTLLVPGAFLEPGLGPSAAKHVAGELADELRSMATWLELDRIAVGEKGDLAKPLARAVR